MKGQVRQESGVGMPRQDLSNWQWNLKYSIKFVYINLCKSVEKFPKFQQKSSVKSSVKSSNFAEAEEFRIYFWPRPRRTEELSSWPRPRPRPRKNRHSSVKPRPRPRTRSTLVHGTDKCTSQYNRLQQNVWRRSHFQEITVPRAIVITSR